MTKLTQTTWLTFDNKIQQLTEQKLTNDSLTEQAGVKLFEAICNKNFEEVEKASKIYASLNPEHIDKHIAFLREKKAAVALIPSQDPEHQQRILNDDPVYARAQQDSNEALLKAFENRTLTEAEYNAAFSVRSPEMLNYQEQVIPLFETLNQDPLLAEEKCVKQSYKNYISKPEVLKRVIKKLIPSAEDLKENTYKEKSKAFNQTVPAGKQLPNSIYGLGTYLKKLLNFQSDKKYNIQEIRNLIYGEWTNSKLDSQDSSWNTAPQQCFKQLYEIDGTIVTEEEYQEHLKNKMANK